jgi:hypothetical protein
VRAGAAKLPYRTETALDSLRNRPHFRLLILDLVFPTEPFGRADRATRPAYLADVMGLRVLAGEDPIIGAPANWFSTDRGHRGSRW